MIQLKSVRTSAPVAELITLDQVKAKVRRLDNDDDAMFSLLCEGVIAHLDGAEGILGRALVAQGWRDVWSRFPAGGSLPLKLCPVLEVESVSYFDNGDQFRTLDAEKYRLHHEVSGSYLRMVAGLNWPATSDRDDAVAINYIAGYGETASAVPAVIRLAALDLVDHWYQPFLDGATEMQMPPKFMDKLRRYVRPKF